MTHHFERCHGLIKVIEELWTVPMMPVAMMLRVLPVVVGVSLLGLSEVDVWAQGGFVLNLPADGTWVRYEGTYLQEETRPENPAGKIDIPPWREQVTIKSVGSEMAEYQGQQVSCRWIEIKVERGREAEGRIDTGLSGLELYKVLIPEGVIHQQPLLEDNIPNDALPIIRGYRQVGTLEPQPLNESMFKVYPLVLMFAYTRNLKLLEQGVNPGTTAGQLGSVDVYAGQTQIERPTSRTDIDLQIQTHAEFPFGVVGWKTTIVRYVKDQQAPRRDFKRFARIEVDMKARQVGSNAISELSVP
ncbi:MAG: hypothetical protein KatS3mg114_0519 [Planctomycetaceae bacterium]|nr:MAG: hypothetical protein KatS3mg114_0519 [Planctomycetaceae bacterium]